MRRALTLSRRHAAWLIVACFANVVAHAPAAFAKSPTPGTEPGTQISKSGGGSSAFDDSFAYAAPRNAPDDAELVLPQPLPPSAVAETRRIFALQQAGKFADADPLIARLSDSTLLGPILAARYLAPTYRSSAAELLNWYEQYNNQPEAPQIYQLLLRKQPAGAALLPPQTVLMPQAEVTAPMARPRGAPDDPGWRRVFVAGLGDWRRGDVAAAAPLFARAAGFGHGSAEERAAGAFWAARTALKLQLPVDYLNWLQQAAGCGATFYGMLAERLLGQGFGPEGDPALTEADVTAVDVTPDGHLAFALLQVGQTAAADTALRALWPDMQNSPSLARAVMAVAARAGLVDVAVAISSEMPQGNEFAGMTLPMPSLHPTGGFTVDPPLVYALARTESGFDPAAASPSGARGLLQLMPDTAGSMRRAAGLSGSAETPAANLALGQAYLRYLGAQTGIGDNLLAILASYNAGPGAASAWYGRLRADSDPLLFIETIPTDQTRHFVRQVLADSWIYAEEIGVAPASLAALAQGQFPTLGLNQELESAN